MYIKFCRRDVVDKKDENFSTKLSVELKGTNGGLCCAHSWSACCSPLSGKQTEGKERLYRFGCLLLTVLCFLLLLVVVFLSMKREWTPPVCSSEAETPKNQIKSLGSQCSHCLLFFSCFFYFLVQSGSPSCSIQEYQQMHNDCKCKTAKVKCKNNKKIK